MNQMIQLSDGTTLTPAYTAFTNGRLYLYLLNGISMGDAFALLNNPELTERIVSVSFGEYATYEGYTNLTSIAKSNGQVHAVLQREEAD